MGDLYQVKEIYGKALGCVASKDIRQGTVILIETPQLVVEDNLTGNNFENVHLTDSSDSAWIKKVVSAFNGMSQVDQNEYLKLYDNYIDLEHSPLPSDLKNQLQKGNFERKSKITSMEKDQDKASKNLHVLNIFKSNSFEGKIAIKTSRFNHSCRPNALAVPGISDSLQIRAMKKIKAGDEITISYLHPNAIFKKRQMRQNILLVGMHFICYCDYCQNHDEDENDLATYEQFEEMENKVAELKTDRTQNSSHATSLEVGF